MKKIIISIAFSIIGLSLSAQNMYDALKFSQDNVLGTARTMAMGNAFTALGGDIGSIHINPAGSSVSNYSVIAISPSLSISSSIAQGTPLGNSNNPYSFENRRKSNYTDYSTATAGILFNFKTYQKRGIKSIAIGYSQSTSYDYSDQLYASGTNSLTSITVAMATAANGIDKVDFENNDAYDYNPWSSVLGWDARIFDPLDNLTNEYVGTAENWTKESEGKYDIGLGGELNQTYIRRVNGSKKDRVFNLGFNINDRIFIGANLGVNAINYDYVDVFSEEAQEPSLFQTGYQSLKYQYKYDASGVGVYGKFGVIAIPAPGLRIGGAIKTVTSTYITEHWYEEASTTFSDPKNNSDAETPEGEYSYKLISPYSFNLGLAYTFGNLGLISFDYELTDYKTMKLKSSDSWDDLTEFSDVNDQIQGLVSNANFMGVSHNIKAGIEIKPTTCLALRAGYGLITSPERFYNEFDEVESIKSNLSNFSFGLGYNSNDSFFVDIAAKRTKYSKEYIMPYDDYLFTDSGNVDIFSPEILNKKSLWNLVMTLGFKF